MLGRYGQHRMCCNLSAEGGERIAVDYISSGYLLQTLALSELNDTDKCLAGP